MLSECNVKSTLNVPVAIAVTAVTIPKIKDGTP